MFGMNNNCYYLLLGNISNFRLNIFIQPHYRCLVLIVPQSGKERTVGRIGGEARNEFVLFALLPSVGLVKLIN